MAEDRPCAVVEAVAAIDAHPRAEGADLAEAWAAEAEWAVVDPDAEAVWVEATGEVIREAAAAARLDDAELVYWPRVYVFVCVHLSVESFIVSFLLSLSLSLSLSLCGFYISFSAFLSFTHFVIFPSALTFIPFLMLLFSPTPLDPPSCPHV